MNKRGAIIVPSFGIDIAGKEFLDPVYLRQLVLFWDIIDCPDDRMLNITFHRNRDDLTLLEKEMIFTRTTGFFFTRREGKPILIMHDEYPQDFWTISQLYSFIKHRQYDTEVFWSISQSFHKLQLPRKETIDYFFFVGSGPFHPTQNGNILALPSEQPLGSNTLEKPLGMALVEGNVLEIELYRALLVPSADIPMEDILEFKMKRKDDLLNYRYVMDGLYLNIIKTRDIPREMNSKIEEVERAISNINKLMKESFKKRLLSSFRIDLDLTTILNGAQKGYALGSIIGLPGLGSILGGVVSTIKFDPVSALKPKVIPQELKDYAYLYYAKEKFS